MTDRRRRNGLVEDEGRGTTARATRTAAVTVRDDDRALWLLYYLELHGAVVALTDEHALHVDLDPMHLDAATVARWAPVIIRCLPEMRIVMLARRESAALTLH